MNQETQSNKNDKNSANQTSQNKKKQTLIIVSIVAISVAVIAIASALIYNYFFKEEIQQEETQNIINEQMTQTLEKDKAEADETNKKTKEIIKKYNLDIYGQYATVYNEIVEDNSANSEQSQGVTTERVTTAMMVNEDNTLNFSDGKKGWWSLEETPEGLIHMGVAKDGAESIEMLLLCDGCMIDVGKAVFFGKIPAEPTFDGEFTDARGTMTLTFKKDGTINGEYNEIVEENGEKFPWTEVYRGEYKKDGMYLDLVLNSSGARYITFTAQTSDPEKTISGFASKYYLKQ